MNAVELRNVTYRYPERDDYALRGLSLKVREGEFILITGSSGSGKSTLCRLLNGLVPRYYGGALSGSVTVDGMDASKHTVGEMSTHVGLVFQDPESQIVMSTVEDEIAFGLENRMLGAGEMEERIRWVSRRLGIAHLLDRRTNELSGGEKQKVVLASTLALKPRVLVLDEPTSQLDAESRMELLRLLKSLTGEGITVLMVEHCLDGVVGRADRVFDIDSGRKVILKVKPHKAAKKPKKTSGEVVLEVRGLCGGYGGRRVLDGVNLEVRAGECLAVTGRNGSGKTTLVKHFNGLLKPVAGSVRLFGMDTRETPTEVLARKISYLPQNPSDMLFCDTVEEELEFTLKHLGVGGDVEATLKKFGLAGHRDSYPRDLSVGEKQRVALAAVLVSNPGVVVLDEPTRGIDAASRETLTSTIREMAAGGTAVVVVTQDRRLAADVASRELRLGGGAVEG